MRNHIHKYFSSQSIRGGIKHNSKAQNFPVNYLLGLAVSVVIFLELLAFFLNVSLNKGTEFNYYSLRDIAIGTIFIVMGIKVSRIYYIGSGLKTMIRIALYASVIGVFLQSRFIVNIAVSSAVVFYMLNLLRGNYLVLTFLGTLSLRLYYLIKMPEMMGIFLVITGVLISCLDLALEKRPKCSFSSGLIKIGVVLFGGGFLTHNYVLITIAVNLLCLYLIQIYRGRLFN